MNYKLIKQGKFYIVYYDIHSADSEYHCKIKSKQKYWNNRKWRMNDLKKNCE